MMHDKSPRARILIGMIAFLDLILRFGIVVLPLVLLKVWSGLVQNGSETVRPRYGLARLLNVLVRLRVMIQVNMERPETVYKLVGLAMNRSSFILKKLF